MISRRTSLLLVLAAAATLAWASTPASQALGLETHVAGFNKPATPPLSPEARLSPEQHRAWEALFDGVASGDSFAPKNVGAAEAPEPVGTQNPTTAWSAKTGRAYDRRVARFWRQYEGQTVADWTVSSVNRRLAPGIQPDLVLVNERSKTIVIHDVTAQATSGHLAKGARYKSYFETKMPGYTVKYSESYWDGLEHIWEALDSKGNLYFPGTSKP